MNKQLALELMKQTYVRLEAAIEADSIRVPAGIRNEYESLRFRTETLCSPAGLKALFPGLR